MKESLIINKFKKMYGKNVFIKLCEPDLFFKDFAGKKKYKKIIMFLQSAIIPL